LEAGKEAPQNFWSERATIADRQGASENENYEAKPTQPDSKFVAKFIDISVFFMKLNLSNQEDKPHIEDFLQKNTQLLNYQLYISNKDH
jgi:hypothetical protein